MSMYPRREDLKVGDQVDVYERATELDHQTKEPILCTVVSTDLSDNDVILVDDGKSYRIAVWQGSDDYFYQF